MPSFIQALSLAALLASTIAAASPNTLPAQETRQIAKFDELSGVSGVAVSNVGEDGIYQGLLWRGWSLNEFGLDGTGVGFDLPVKIPGCIPNTPDNSIAFATDNPQTVQGGGTFMDTNYFMSPVTTVNLYSMYYCCVSATEASVTAAPLSCIISATCNQKGGGKVGPQEFKFDVALGQTSAEMKKAYPIGFQNCTNIEFQVRGLTLSGGAADSATAGHMDTVEYSTGA